MANFSSGLIMNAIQRIFSQVDMIINNENIVLDLLTRPENIKSIIENMIIQLNFEFVNLKNNLLENIIDKEIKSKPRLKDKLIQRAIELFKMILKVSVSSNLFLIK